jgi:Protein of unknown function (DUF3768)
LFPSPAELSTVNPDTVHDHSQPACHRRPNRQDHRGVRRFLPPNDPYGEHDFGSFNADGHRIFSKIDYFDKALTAHSPDPSDPPVTKRVITIMLAEEY